MDFTSFVILSLATWRLASMLTREDGPFFIFKRIREMTGITHDTESDVFEVPENFWAQLLSCIFCASMWVAIGWVAFWILNVNVAIWVALPFAISAGALFFEKYA